MTLYETKIVVADYNFNQVVQIDSLYNGDSTWKTNQPGLIAPLSPIEIDFDSRGRIYISRYSSTNQVIRISNIDSLVYDPIVNIVAVTFFNSIAIDRKNNILFFERSDNQLYSCSCNGGSITGPYPRTGIGQTIQIIYGMAYDENENVLYIAGRNTERKQLLQDFSNIALPLKVQKYSFV